MRSLARSKSVLKVSHKHNEPPSEAEIRNFDLVGYYEVFPPKRMNVSTKTVDVADSTGGKVLKRILVADKDFTTGEVIYIVMWPSVLSHGLGWLIK
jgi:hypothetical protein